MTKGMITDTRLKLRSSYRLLQLIDHNKNSIAEIPENILKALRSSGFTLPSKVEILRAETTFEAPKIDYKLLAALSNDLTEPEKSNEKQQQLEKETSLKTENSAEAYLYLSDLQWLNNFLAKLRKEQGLNVYLYSLLEKCNLELPENAVIERNPELEARCQKLREQQQNREYRNMTKDVDATLKNFPEDTIAYQMKAINSQLIAVLQFAFSVAAGFVFGFLGIELIIGNLDFGFRLLLGIICALVIALAEMYFLAKKLNEYDNTTETAQTASQPQSPQKSKKVHTD